MQQSVCVVIPCYRVTQHILSVVAAIPDHVQQIYCIDDSCPDKSGAFIAEKCPDPRVTIIYNPQNLGVGGAVMVGYKAALKDGHTIAVKIDGDGQMDPSLVKRFIRPILKGEADYTKGNRFYDLNSLKNMPRIRIFGNAVLSLMTKLSSGYWNIFDATNGYTAIHLSMIPYLSLDKIHKRYFFETDMLFRLYTVRAVVKDIPMQAVYAKEISHLKISRILGTFLLGHGRNIVKRLFYSYLLRDFQLASLYFIVGAILLCFGTVFGIHAWMTSINTNIPATSGTVWLASLPIIIGVQLFLSALTFDVLNIPKTPIHPLLVDDSSVDNI